MTSPTYSTGSYKRSRSAFTLVELLVVIAVIGILVGMLMVGLGPVMVRVHQFAISTEIKQMEASMESFKTKHGFYPPSFEVFADINGDGAINGSDTDADRVILFKRYLNRVAPNHNYSNAQLLAWWETIGMQMVPQNVTVPATEPYGADLVFWLSGLTTNKQFPLGDPTAWTSGDPTTFLAGHSLGGDAVERDVLFDFDSSRLMFSADTKIAGYYQARGPQVTYRFASSQPTYVVGFGYQQAGGAFYNPESFQIIAAGRDGEFGMPGLIGNAGNYGNDDMCSFADGTLEKELFK